MSRVRTTLNYYLARLYLADVLGFAAAIVSVMAIFDILELVRRTSKADALELPLVMHLALLKMPENLLTIAPFAVLFAAIFTFSQLIKRQELVVMRTSGASLWRILAAMFAVAFAFGVVLVTIIHPLSAATQAKYQQYEERYLRKEQHMISLLNQGLWLRQTTSNGYFLLYARRVNLPDWALSDVMVQFFNHDYQWQQRLDAPAAALTTGAWVFPQGTLVVAGKSGQAVTNFKIPTDLTREEIEHSFATPETVSFWQMPSFIKMLRETGFPVSQLQVQYASLWVFPVLLLSLVMLAATVSIRPPRQAGQIWRIVAGISLGFLVFFITNFLHALGGSQQIPVLLAAAGPALMALASGAMGILSLEER